MATSTDDSTKSKRFTFTVSGLPEEEFVVLSFEGYEAISNPYRFEIDLVSEDLEVDGLLNRMQSQGLCPFHPQQPNQRPIFS